MNTSTTTDRRTFLKQGAVGLGTLGLMAATSPLFAREDEQPLGVALVGLGYYAIQKLAVGLQHTKYCQLRGLVTGTPEKAKKYGKEFNIPEKNIYNYDTFDDIKNNPDIDIVYVVLPNALHAEYVIRAAKAGKHVMCEKPFDISVKKCEEAVKACKKAGKLLQIGYRCQYDPYHQELMRLGQKKVMGDVKLIRTGHSFYGVHNDNWRFTDASLSGGGPLMDVGIYCIQGCRYTLGQNPIAVEARTYKTFKDKMPGMEETIMWHMEFEGGAVANCTSSYVSRENFIHVSAENGNFGLEPCYGYDGAQGSARKHQLNFSTRNQQAAQMDAFARNILDDTPVIASGEDGLIDMQIVEAIYESAKAKTRVEIKY
ncbi:MAG: Gfo/Idh/MocA family oxidoreductase [Bacteroidota bacterium]